MKKYTLFFVLLLGFLNLYSQAPNKLSYQIEVTNKYDQLVTNQLINVKISILKNSSEGSVIYSEYHMATTDYTGIANVEIGTGNETNGLFENIDWSEGPFFIKTEIDPEGGFNYSTKGVSELLSVPYSLYSHIAEKVLNASYNDLSDRPVGNSKGDILYWNGDGWTIIPIGTPGQLLQVNTEGVPFWANAYITEDGSREAPGVSTVSFSGLTSNSVTVSGYTTSNVVEHGFTYSTSPYHTYLGAFSGGSFSTTITNLSSATTYYFRAIAINSDGEVGYGNFIQFTTLPTVPTVTTLPATNIDYSSGYTGGNVTYSGGAAVTSRGVCWNSTGNPTIADSHTSNGSGTGTFTSYVGSIYNTSVYVRAYATNSVGISYGNQITISTRPPTVFTNNASSITCSSVILSNYISSSGGTSMTECGVCYSTSSNPTMATRTILSPVGGYNGSTVTGLLPNTLYYYKAYATNSCGTSYGVIKSFSTSNAVPHVVTTNAMSLIKGNSAVSGGVITGCGSIIISRGVCWSTSNNPTINNFKTIDGSGFGSYTSNLTGLTLNVTYYVRAYATTSTGTIYGNELTFLTRLNIGDDWEGGKVFYIYNDAHGFVAAPTDLDGTYTFNNAWQTCENLSLNGYGDWFLGPEDIMDWLYDNRAAIGNLSQVYWTSENVSNETAKCLSFDNGEFYTTDKSNSFKVRPIREF